MAEGADPMQDTEELFTNTDNKRLSPEEAVAEIEFCRMLAGWPTLASIGRGVAPPPPASKDTPPAPPHRMRWCPSHQQPRLAPHSHCLQHRKLTSEQQVAIERHLLMEAVGAEGPKRPAISQLYQSTDYG